MPFLVFEMRFERSADSGEMRRAIAQDTAKHRNTTTAPSIAVVVSLETTRRGYAMALLTIWFLLLLAHGPQEK